MRNSKAEKIDLVQKAAVLTQGKRIGLMGSVGACPNPWRCPVCNYNIRLLVHHESEIQIDCLRCFASPMRQLTLNDIVRMMPA